jgi:hypothetical protein
METTRVQKVSVISTDEVFLCFKWIDLKFDIPIVQSADFYNMLLEFANVEKAIKRVVASFH